MEPSTIFATVNTITSLLRKLRDAAKTMDKAEIGGIIIELNDAMMDLQLKQQELINENQQLRTENQELNEKLNIKENLEYHYEAYWIRKDDDSLDGPFSQQMWDNEHKFIRLRFVRKDRWINKGEALLFVNKDVSGGERLREEEYCKVPFKFIEDRVPTYMELIT
jgi:hypothetical protein